MKVAYLSSAYLAPIEYYSKLLNYDKIFIEQHDHYMKQTYRNRCTCRSGGRTGTFCSYRKTGKPEMSDEGYPDFRPWQLEAPALECNGVGL